MGKNKDRESLIRLLANTIVHEIVAEHTNRPESKHFLHSEFIEYRSQTEKTAQEYNWNNEDKNYIEKEALKMIKEKLSLKYSDISYKGHEALAKLKKLIDEIL